MALQPLVGQDLLIFKASRIHSDTSHSLRPWMSDRSVTYISTWQHTTLTTETSMPPAVLECTIRASEWQHTYTSDGAASGIRNILMFMRNIPCSYPTHQVQMITKRRHTSTALHTSTHKMLQYLLLLHISTYWIRTAATGCLPNCS
jgi:hypothetical protein